MNELMKTFQELTPRCSKSAIASMLGDVIDYVKYLENQIQFIGPLSLPPPMHHQNLFIQEDEMKSWPLGPPYPAPFYLYPDIHTSQPSRVDLQTPQPNPGSNQPHLPAYINPYGYFVSLLQQMQQPPPPVESQTTTQPSFSHASGSRDLQNPDIQPPGD